MKTKIAAAVAVLSTVLVGVASPAPAWGAPTPPAPACQWQNPDDLQTLRVALRSTRDSYRAGEVATMEALVERDVAGHIEPAEGVNVVVRVDVKEVQLYGAGVTDEAGIATIQIRLKRSTPTGAADAVASATKKYGDGHCLGFREEGHAEFDDLFTVRRAR
ncbi:MAG: hypothetical protein ACRDJI_08290 [Actinomycetota bacterium]